MGACKWEGQVPGFDEFRTRRSPVHSVVVEGDGERRVGAGAVLVQRVHVEAVGGVGGDDEGRGDGGKCRYQVHDWEKELHVGNGVDFLIVGRSKR